MSTPLDDTAAAAFAALLRILRRTGDDRASDGADADRIEPPQRPERMRTADVRAALQHPDRLLVGADHLPVRVRLTPLLRFAVWLDQGPGIPRELASQAARFQFLVWSFLPRLDPDVERHACPGHVTWSPETTGTAQITVDRDEVRDRARAARQQWLEFLTAWEDDPWLAGLHHQADTRIAHDVLWIALRDPACSSRPLDLSATGTSQRAARAEQRRVAADLAEIHALPAGNLALAARLQSRPLGLGVLLAAVLPAAGIADTVVLLTAGGAPARILALTALAVPILGAPLLPPRLDSLALLRVPAAVAAGQIVLLALTSRWWLSPDGWLIGAGLIALSYLYLVIERRLHGATRRAAVGHGATLTLFGVLTSILLSVTSLGFVVPAMGEHGECLAAWWTKPVTASRPLNDHCLAALNLPPGAQAPPVLGVLVLMTGFCLAVGLAAQILWDDRPVTAPLGRIRRVRGGPS
ncbi:hypothetical protein [Kutzneria sp. 744]|uniref:hypothetical protein n=1 Tax=Kutzneria sp. (strain 744) TaxID=345341 RepID=UPI0003EEB3E0|nr:hypothetical protein [Kutzneria sp. 744]EWM19879.1 PE-PGRS family protein [Kutzneria sp. 744]